MTDMKQERNGRCLVDDWNFSTETVFRISKLLDDFRHEFSRTKPALLARLVAKNEAAPLQIDFVRKVFTGPDQDAAISRSATDNPDSFGSKETPLCFEFTGSSFVDSFRREKDRHTRKIAINSAFDKATELLLATRPGGKKEALWNQLTALFRGAYKGTTLIGVLEQLEECISDLASTAGQDNTTPSDEKFRLLSLFFVFYSRLNIAGEAVATVSSVHFSNASEFRRGCANCYGYLIESDRAKGIDHAMLRIDNAGCASPVREKFLGKTRAESLYFPDSEVQVNGLSHGDIRNDFFYDSYLVFNPDALDKSGTITTIIPENRVYDLVIPVYEMDDITRRQHREEHVVSGPFLGWLFVRLDDNALTEILAPDKKSNWKQKWDMLCLKKGKLAKGLADEIQQLRFALNRFSELYLLGEMEWAIEQPWLEATDAARFTTEHYYNCDGWIQDVELTISNEILTKILDNGYSVFCQLRDGILHAVPNTIQANYISHIVVDVGRSFGIDEKGIGQPILLVFRRRVTTSVPIASEDREFYRLWLTENIRRFYEMARMREGERRAGRIANQRTHDQMVGHEMRKLTEIIRVGSSEFAYDVLRRQLNSLAMESEGHQIFTNEKTVAKEDLPLCYDPEIADFWELLQKVSEFSFFVHILKDKAKNTPQDLKDPNLSAFSASKYIDWKAGMTGDVNVHNITINQGFNRRLARFLVRMMIAAVGNYFKHAEREPLSISLETIPDVYHLLHLDNPCSLQPKSRNGTYAVLRYDLENYVSLSHELRHNEFGATDQQVWDALYFDKMKNTQVFRTTLPLPLSFLSY